MEYKRKPLTLYNQIPQQKIKKHDSDLFVKDNEYKITKVKEINEKKEVNKNIENDKINAQSEKIIYSNEDKDKNSRIITYNCQPPTNEKDIFRSTWINSKSISIKKINRFIPNKPERVLDAPKIGDDYYSELFDWSLNNQIAISLDSIIYIWDATYGTINTIGNSKEIGSICSLKWSNDGSYLGIGTSEGETQIWDTVNNRKLRTIKRKQDNTSKLDYKIKSKNEEEENLKSKNINNIEPRVGCLSWNKNILTSAYNDGFIHHNDVRIKNSFISIFQAHNSNICGLKWRSDGEYLASGGNDNLVKLWDLKSSKPYMEKADHNAAVKAMAWCPWQLNLLATGGGISDKTLRLWNITTQANLKNIKTESQITSIIWSNHYTELLTTHGYSTNDINIWKFPTMDRISNIKGHDSRILYSALSPDGQTVATVASDETLKFWSVFNQQSKRSFSSAFNSESSNNAIYKTIKNKKNHFR